MVASVLMLRSPAGHFRADLMQLRHISAAVCDYKPSWTNRLPMCCTKRGDEGLVSR
jgi:hypothetical protein